MIQGSLPAWTQEAYRPPRSHSKSLLFPGGGRGVPSAKIFFSGLNMYQAKSSGVKNFSLYWWAGGGGGGCLCENFFFQSEHVSSQIWCQKFFPLLRGGALCEIFFPVWTCIKPNLVSKIFAFTGGGGGVPLQKFFFPIWTCIKPNLVSKIFAFTGGVGGTMG